MRLVGAAVEELPPLAALHLFGGHGSSRGGASGRPSSWSDPLDAGRTRSSRCGGRRGARRPSVFALYRLHVAQLDKDDLFGALLPDQVEIDMDVIGKWLAA